MHAPSGRITAIDPRGGAAVLGDNGVGKTTTLRILPLFFGHPPSHIVGAGQGQEPMIRFVLPTDASAIAFEYQRGSANASDLRLAVIRRRADDPNVAFYRLYRSGFVKELFVGDGRFLSDEETQQKATEMGIPTTSKLTTSEYRSVILRIPANSKDKDKLRRYSVDWSFGPKHLDNLDRVVAAMVKKHIHFDDIVQVAVGMVQRDLGQGAERAKITFKQGREPIERWLRNREACLDAFKRESEFTELENNLREHRSAAARLRSCRADVTVVTSARKKEAVALTEALDNLAAANSTRLEIELTQKRKLEENAAVCARAAVMAQQASVEAVSEASTFEKEGAKNWEILVQEIPAIRANWRTAQAQVEATQTHHQEATMHYSRLEHEAEKRANDEILALEKSKESHSVRLSESLAQIVAAENEALRLCDEAFASKRQKLEEDKEPLLVQRGTWENLKKNPSVSSEAQAEMDEASTRLQRQTEATAVAQQSLDQNLREQERARTAFSTQEGSVSKANEAMARAQRQVAIAQERLTPPAGTLLAALRAQDLSRAHRNLARVINPALLQRTDLDPALMDEDEGTAYGWRINTCAITLPEWMDDALMRSAIDAAKEALASAQTDLQTQRENLESKSRRLKELDLAVQTMQASVSVLQAQTSECKNRLETARLRLAVERKDATSLAEAQIHKINSALDALKLQRSSLDREHADARSAIKQSHVKLKADASSLRDTAICAIGKSIDNIKRGLKDAVAALAQQLKEHLSKEGVDVVRLNTLKDEVQKLNQQIQEREDKKTLVDRWKQWLDKGGPTAVETLKATSQRANLASMDAARQASEHQQSMQKSASDHEALVSEKTKRQNQVRDDIDTLMQMDSIFGDYMETGSSVINENTPASTLKAKARELRADIDRLEGSIRRETSILQQALTAKASTVKELIEAGLNESEEKCTIRRATALCGCYRQIGMQVANDVNITLKTLLAHIGAFQKDIHSFEREVGLFNRRLQSGLNEVKCFDRVKDLRLDIVTNFSELGFYKKLSRMEDVVRQHASEIGKDYSRDLPPDDTARALADFMSVLGPDGNVELNLSQRIALRGSLSDNGRHKEFKRSSELESISSEGLTSLVLITLMTALLNTIRGAEPVHVPWVTDEVGKFDPSNFRALMMRLKDNRIDVVTASPELGPAQHSMFAQRYLFEDRGRIREYRSLQSSGIDRSSQNTPETVQ